jgi:hypothetical protein
MKPTYEQLEAENALLQKQVARQRAEIQLLQNEIIIHQKANRILAEVFQPEPPVYQLHILR